MWPLQSSETWERMRKWSLVFLAEQTLTRPRESPRSAREPKRCREEAQSCGVCLLDHRITPSRARHATVTNTCTRLITCNRAVLLSVCSSCSARPPAPSSPSSAQTHAGQFLGDTRYVSRGHMRPSPLRNRPPMPQTVRCQRHPCLVVTHHE